MKEAGFGALVLAVCRLFCVFACRLKKAFELTERTKSWRSRSKQPTRHQGPMLQI